MSVAFVYYVTYGGSSWEKENFLPDQFYIANDSYKIKAHILTTNHTNHIW